MSTLTFHLARALGRGFAPGDEIVVTELDHHANVDPWRDMARERGLTVRVARLDPKAGQLDWDDLRRQMSGRTKLLAIGAASNALGTINDVAEAGRMAHDAGALLFVDAVHYAPHRLVDVRAMDCDFLACSAYKFYGPHVGVLYGKHDLLAHLDVPKLRPAPDTAPERLETGTQNHEGIVGAAAAVEFLASLADRADPARSAPGHFRRPPRARCGARRAALAGADRDRWGAALRARRPRNRAPPRSRSPSATSPPKRSAAAWPAGGSSPLTATSTPRRRSSAWASPDAGWSGSAAPATPREEEIDRLLDAVRAIGS